MRLYTILMRSSFLILVLISSVFAGQSINISSGNYCSFSDPNVSTTTDWRVEFQLHDYIVPGSNVLLLGLSGLGFGVEARTDGTLLIQDNRDTVNGSTYIDMTGRTNVLIRVQRNHAGALFSAEVWNVDSSNYAIDSDTITAENAWPYSGGLVGYTTTATASIGFLRMWDTLVPLRSKPPTTAPSGIPILHLKFDGNLNDSGPNGRNCTGVGTIAYTNPTPTIGTGVYSIPTTYGAPTWTDSIPCRAGTNCTLDGSASYSMADASDTVSYFWQELSGPSVASWSSRTSAQPILTGLIFGPYSILLKVMDAAGNLATSLLDLGAVATDSNGVVVQADPNVTKIFGEMMAHGRNPWTWFDEKRWASATARAPGGVNAYDTNPLWLTNLPGTITYTPSTNTTTIQTTLNGSITGSSMSFDLVDASKLDWSSLPTIIMLHEPNSYNVKEQIVICNQSGNTLTVCYDGRAWRRGLYEQVSAPASWASGTIVRQIKTVGTSTTFLTNFCPAGIGEPGSVNYSTGTVSVTPGSTGLTGSGTTWTSAMESLRIRIQGFHGGTPFTFFASIVGSPSAGSLTMSRAWPSDADSGSVNYAILNNDLGFISRNWTRTDATNGRQQEGISACLSDTELIHTEIFTSMTSTTQTNKNYALSISWVSDFGPSYYDEPLAHYAGYFVSGMQRFLSNARNLGDLWLSQPALDEGWVQASPRRMSLTGMLAAAVLDNRSSNWYGLRRYADIALTGNAVGGACTADIRETAYQQSWIAWSALFEPDATRKATMQTALTSVYNRDNGCKNAEAGSIFDSGYDSTNSFPTPYFAGTGAYTMVAGDPNVTGTGFTSAVCNKVASGSGLVMSVGQTNITGASGFVSQPSGKIVIFATRGGAPYLFYSLYTYISSSSITLASAFDGDAGTYSWQIESDTSWLQFALSGSDYPNLGRLYTCTFNSSSSLTLDRGWEGTSGTYTAYRQGEVGYGTQPFLLGVKSLMMRLAAQGATGSTATNIANLNIAMSDYILGEGFDTGTKGLHYARGWRGCEPVSNPRMNCTYSTSDSGKQSARFLNAEAQTPFVIKYQADPSPANLAAGDEFYGGQWGKYGGPWSDGVYLTALDDSGIWAYKWLGFMFGIGMGHQWPAVRLGGVAAEDLVTYKFQFTLPANADKVVLSVLQPSGKLVYPAECTTSPCEFTYDRRQGSHRLRWEFKTTGDVGRGPSDWAILP